MNASNKVIGKQKSNNPKLGNYKLDNEDNFFSSSTLKRNGDYALGKDSWQKVDLDFKNRSPSRIMGISSSSFGSAKDIGSEEEKLKASSSNWNYDEHGFVQKLLSSKKK